MLTQETEVWSKFTKIGCAGRDRFLIFASVLCSLFVFSGHASAQITDFLPTLKSGMETSTVTPDSARSVLGASITHTKLLNFADDELNSVARGLDYNPEKIFEYVNSSVKIHPTFGLSKGALGAHLDKSGTSFDQAALLVELFRIAGENDAAVSDISYELGDLTLSGQDFESWMGVAKPAEACWLLANGGIPAEINGGTDCLSLASGSTIESVKLMHVRVSATVDGTSRVFDPSLKKSVKASVFQPQFEPGDDQYRVAGPAALGEGIWSDHLSSSCRNSSKMAGANEEILSESVFVRGFDLQSIQSQLSACAASLWGAIDADAPSHSAAQLLGTRVIDLDADQGEFQEAAEFSSVSSDLESIPDQYRISVTIQYDMGSSTNLIDTQVFADEIYARRLSLVPNGFELTSNSIARPDLPFAQPNNCSVRASEYNWTVELKIGRTPLAGLLVNGSPDQNTGFRANCPPYQRGGILRLGVDMPYAADGYGDDTFQMSSTLVSTAVLALGIGDSSAVTEAFYTERLGYDRPSFWLQEPNDTCSGECEPPLGLSTGTIRMSENVRFRLAASWAKQFSAFMRLFDSIEDDQRVINHFSIGWVNARTIVSGDADQTATPAPVTYEASVAWSIGSDALTMSLDSLVSFSARPRGQDHLASLFTVSQMSSNLETSVFAQLTDHTALTGIAHKFEWANRLDKGEPNFTETHGGEDADVQFGYYYFQQGDDLSQLTSSGVDEYDDIPENGALEGSLSNALNGYLGAGFDVISASDAYLGPGLRCGPTFVAGTRPSLGSYTDDNPDENSTVVFISRTGEVMDIRSGDTRHSASGGGGGVPIYKCFSNSARGGAFVAFNSDSGETALVQVFEHGIAKGGGAGSAMPGEIAAHATPASSDILEQQNNIVHAHSVAPQSGRLSYTHENIVSTGTMPFPQDLGFSRATSSGPIEPDKPIWSHNWHMPLTYSSSGDESFGESRGLFATDVLTATMALRGLYSHASISADGLTSETKAERSKVHVSAALVSYWLLERMRKNSVTIVANGDASTFVRKLGTDEFVSASGGGAKVLKTGSERKDFAPLMVGLRRFSTAEDWMYDELAFKWIGTDKSEIDFEYWSAFHPEPWSGANEHGHKFGFHAVSWDFPSGMEIDLEYDFSECQIRNSPLKPCSKPKLTSVTNNLGRSLEFEGAAEEPTSVVAYTNAGASGGLTAILSTGKVTLPDESEISFRFSQDSFCVDHDTNVPGRCGLGMRNTIRLKSVLLPEDDDAIPSARFEYDERSRAIGFTNASDKTWEFNWGGGRLFGEIDPLGFVSGKKLDEVGRIVSQTSQRGVELRYRHDGIGRPIETRIRDSELEGAGEYSARTSTVYDNLGNPIESRVHTKTVVGSDVTQSFTEAFPGNAEYDPILISREFDARPNGFVRNKLSETDAMGATTSFEYFDASGLLEKIHGPSGELSSFTYNSFGQVETESHLLDSDAATVSRYIYESGRVDAVVMDEGGLDILTSYGYDDHGNLNSITDARDNVTSATFDAARRLKTIRDAEGGGADYDYDDNGRLKALSTLMDDGFATAHIHYTPTGRPDYVDDPAGDRTSYTYDDRGKLLTVTDSDNRASKYEYYEDGSVHKFIRGVGTELEQVEARKWYGFDGALIRLRPARGNLTGSDVFDTTYHYDQFGRIYEAVFADGSKETSSFRSDGLPAKRSLRLSESDLNDGLSSFLHFEYDDSKRLTRQYEEHRTPSGTEFKNFVKFDYDLAGRVTRKYEVDANSNFNSELNDEQVYTYDALGRVEYETANSLTVGYKYDAAGNRERITWPGDENFFVDYLYDDANRLTDVVLNDTQTLALYIYDKRGNMEYAAYGNGVTAAFNHEIDNDLDVLSYHLYTESGEPEVLGWNYDYLPSGKLQKADLISGSHPAWQPDANLEFTYASTSVSGQAANVLDQYERVIGPGGEKAFEFDGRGNLTSVFGTGDTRSYQYDLQNRLLSAEVNGADLLFDYDVDGRRVGKSVNGQEVRYLHAGDMEIAEYDAAGNVLRRYIPGGAIDARIGWIEGSEADSEKLEYYHVDRQGSVVALTNAEARVTDRYAYDPFGNEASDAALAGNLFRYTGRKLDPETGLYYYRARYYDPDLGRFLQTDPVGYADQINLYTYVHNDPLSYTDPSGKCVWDLCIGETTLVVIGVSALVGCFFACDDAVEAATGTSDGTILGDNAISHMFEDRSSSPLDPLVSNSEGLEWGKIVPLPGEDYADFMDRIRKDCGRACLDQQIEDYENGDRDNLDNQEVRGRTNDMIDKILDKIELDDYFDDDGNPIDPE